MPLRKEDDSGTNRDGSKSDEYCHFCFQNGVFMDEGISLDGKIEKVTDIAIKMDIPEHQARSMAETLLPSLKRWKK